MGNAKSQGISRVKRRRQSKAVKQWIKGLKKVGSREKPMCKIMGIAGISAERRVMAQCFAEAAVEYLTKADNDSFGYAACSAKGVQYGERWLDPKKSFDERPAPVERTQEQLDIIQMFQGAIYVPALPVVYNHFGKRAEESMSAITLHGRMATCGKGIQNAHPFVKDGVSLIHNGVIYNAAQLGYINSTCDSESILKLYLEEEVSKNPANIQAVVNKLHGYYACMVFGKDKEGVPYLDIFKEERANLCVTWVDEVGWVYCTNFDIVNNTAQDLALQIQYSYDIVEGCLIRINVETGGIMSVTKFDLDQSGTGGTGDVTHFPHYYANDRGTGTPSSHVSSAYPARDASARCGQDSTNDSFSEEEIAALIAERLVHQKGY